jgi:hypothetical protein
MADIGLSSGAFRTRFVDEPAARAAARDARCVGFVVDVEPAADHGWLTVSRRRQPFAPDDAARYAGRLRTIAAAHGGDYEEYDEEQQL